MPRRFYKDAYGKVDPSLVGFSNKLAEVDLSEPEYTHRHPVTGELCACNYGTPKQQPETKVAAEEGRPDPTVWLVASDEPLASSLERYLGDQFNFVVIPFPERGRLRKADVPAMRDGLPDLIVTTWLPDRTFAPELEETLGGRVPILTMSSEEAEALKFPDDNCRVVLENGRRCPYEALEGSLYCGLPHHAELSTPEDVVPSEEEKLDALADWQMAGDAFGEKMTNTIVNAQEDYTPDLKTDVGRQIYKQNQKMFRINGPLTKETGDKNAGPKTLEFLDNLVYDHQAPSLLPWLASRLKKGDIKVKFSAWGEPSDLLPMTNEDIDRWATAQWFPKVAAWAEARQSPFRQGKNIAEMDASEVINLANQHNEWVESKKQYEQHKDEIESTEGEKREMDARDLRAAGPEGFSLASQRVADMPDVIAEINRKIESGELDPDNYNYVLDRVSLDPNDYKGWKVVKIQNTRDAELETAILRHCIGDSNHPYWHAIDEGAIDAYSLRDANGVPKVSWHYNTEDAYEPNSLAHIQGKSGYPRQDFRDLISLYNIAAEIDDDGGGQGDEESLEGRFGGQREVDFGLITEVEELESILDDPYDYAYRYHDAYDLHEDVEFQANIDDYAIGRDLVKNYQGWSAPLMDALMSGTHFDVSLKSIIEGTLAALEDEWEIFDYGDYYYDEEGDTQKNHEFNLSSIETMNEAGLVDDNLVSFLQAVGAKPDTPLNELDIPNTFDYMYAQPYPANEYEIGERDRTWGTDERTRELEQKGIREHPQPLAEQRTKEGIPIQMAPGAQQVWRGGELEMLKPNTPAGFVSPRQNPNRIAEEYWRIWQTEGQQAAAEWYYDQFRDDLTVRTPGPDRPELDRQTPTVRVPVQLNSSWNDLMRW